MAAVDEVSKGRTARRMAVDTLELSGQASGVACLSVKCFLPGNAHLIKFLDSRGATTRECHKSCIIPTRK